MKPLGDTRDRKAVLLVSEGFVYDPAEPGYRLVVEAARRANAALYFIDTRGLDDMPGFYSAQFGKMIDEKNVLAAIADMTQESEGAVSLARDTGGFTVAKTNDLETGIVRIGRESRSYYLLGYSPGNVPRDGRFRRIEVRVRRPGAIVRARRGYFAPSDAPDAEAAKTTSRTDPQIQYGLDAPTPLDGIPLRMTAYVLEDDEPGPGAGPGRGRRRRLEGRVHRDRGTADGRPRHARRGRAPRELRRLPQRPEGRPRAQARPRGEPELVHDRAGVRAARRGLPGEARRARRHEPPASAR